MSLLGAWLVSDSQWWSMVVLRLKMTRWVSEGEVEEEDLARDVKQLVVRFAASFIFLHCHWALFRPVGHNTLNQGHFRSWSWFLIFSNLKMLHLILIWPPRFSQVNVKNERSKPKDEGSGKELPEAGNEACRGWSSAAGSWSEAGETWRATSVSSATNSFASSSFFTSSLCSHCSHSVCWLMVISEH